MKLHNHNDYSESPVHVYYDHHFQLNSPKVKKMRILLEKTLSSYYPSFVSMLDTVNAGTFSGLLIILIMARKELTSTMHDIVGASLSE